MSGLFIIIQRMFRVTSDAILLIYDYACLFTVVYLPLANVLEGDNSIIRMLPFLSSIGM